MARIIGRGRYAGETYPERSPGGGSSGGDDMVLVDSSDTTPGFLTDKISVVTSSLQKTILNPGENEILQFDLTPGSTPGDTLVWDGTEWNTQQPVTGHTTSDITDSSGAYTLVAGTDQFVTHDSGGGLLETTFHKATDSGNTIEFSITVHNTGGGSAQISLFFGTSPDGGVTFDQSSGACTATVPPGAYATLAKMIEYRGGAADPIFRVYYTSTANLQIGGNLAGGVLLGRFNQ